MRSHLVITNLTLCESALSALQKGDTKDAEDALNAIYIVNEGWPFTLPSVEKAYLALTIEANGAGPVPASWGTPSYLVADSIATLRTLL